MYSLCAENQNCELTSERVRANTFSSAVKNLAKKMCIQHLGFQGFWRLGRLSSMESFYDFSFIF